MAKNIFRPPTIGFMVLGSFSSMLLAGCAVSSMVGNEGHLKSLDRSLYQAAQNFQQMRDYTTSVKYFRKLYQRDVKVVKVIVGLSSGLRQLKKSIEAQAIVLRALKDAPKNVDLLTEMGKVQLALEVD